MNRRRYLRRLGASAAAIGLAGCASPGAETPTGDVGEGTPVVDGTPAGTPTAGGAADGTPTAVGTPEETPTADGTEAGTPGTAEGTPGTAEGTQTGTAGGGAAQAPNEVRMVTADGDYYFDPVGLYVEPGETITWINDSGAHSSTAYTQENPQSDVRRIPEQAEGWDSGTLTEQGAEFTHTFEVEGTYDYYCVPHKALEMVGRLVVGEPGGVEGDPPDAAVPSEQRIVEEGAVGAGAFQSG